MSLSFGSAVTPAASFVVSPLKSNWSARFERARGLVTAVTARTLRREILTSLPVRNAGVA